MAEFRHTPAQRMLLRAYPGQTLGEVLADGINTHGTVEDAAKQFEISAASYRSWMRQERVVTDRDGHASVAREPSPLVAA